MTPLPPFPGPDAPVACRMGLALSDGRLRLLGGSFSIKSEAGVGTRIDITMPADKGPAV